MGKVYEIKGNLITLARQNKFDVIVHGCNCFCTMGAGIAPQMAKEFGADKFPLERPIHKGDYNKLGQIDFRKLYYVGREFIYYPSYDEYQDCNIEVTVVNAYTQYGFGANHKGGAKAPIDYLALRLVMQKINHIFAGQHIGLPWIGAGLAGGNWEYIKRIIVEELVDCTVTLIEYDGSK